MASNRAPKLIPFLCAVQATHVSLIVANYGLKMDKDKENEYQAKIRSLEASLKAFEKEKSELELADLRKRKYRVRLT